MDIKIYDTKDGDDYVVKNVPAETLEEACKKVAEKKGWVWIGKPCDNISLSWNWYAVDKKVYEAFYKGKDYDFDEDVARVKAGELEEFRGLYELFENDTESEEF